MRPKTIPDSLRLAASMMGKRKRGVIERKSLAKAVSSRINATIATAERKGLHDQADRIRWEHYPEKMRAKELARKLGA